MAKYKSQTGISFIIAEKEDGTYDVNMGSNADLPQDGLPVNLYTGIIQAVCDLVEAHNKNTCSCSDTKLMQAFDNTRRAAERFFKKENSYIVKVMLPARIISYKVHDISPGKAAKYIEANYLDKKNDEQIVAVLEGEDLTSVFNQQSE